jgi:hypothetical protein
VPVGVTLLRDNIQAGARARAWWCITYACRVGFISTKLAAGGHRHQSGSRESPPRHELLLLPVALLARMKSSGSGACVANRSVLVFIAESTVRGVWPAAMTSYALSPIQSTSYRITLRSDTGRRRACAYAAACSYTKRCQRPALVWRGEGTGGFHRQLGSRNVMCESG